jgi:hypothetical protein
VQGGAMSPQQFGEFGGRPGGAETGRSVRPASGTVRRMARIAPEVARRDVRRCSGSMVDSLPEIQAADEYYGPARIPRLEPQKQVFLVAYRSP